MIQTDNRGFSLYALDSPQTLRTLRSKLEKLRADRKDELEVAQDWPDFKRRVGVLEGIDEALQVCDDIERAERA